MKLKKADIPFYFKYHLTSGFISNYKYIPKFQYHKSANSSKKEVDINIPLHVTKNIEEAQLVLKKMLNSLPKGSLLYKYLESECCWLLEPLKGSFRINILESFLPSYIFSDTITYDLKNNKEAENHPRRLAGTSGCYLFTNILTNQQYIGSSIDLYNRFKSHKINSIRPNRGGNTPLYR